MQISNINIRITVINGYLVLISSIVSTPPDLLQSEAERKLAEANKE